MMQSLTRTQPGAAAGAPLALPRKRAHTILLVYLGLAVVVLLAVGGSAYWVYHNVVLVGRDAAGHLEQSILVAKALASRSWQGLFEAMVLDEYRPPGLYLLTQPAYWLFGRSQQTALIPNIAMLGAVVVLTFVLARKVLNDWLALFAALLGQPPADGRRHGTPVLHGNPADDGPAAGPAGAAQERWLCLTAGWALAFGAGLGVMLLVKWTTPIYLLIPLLFVLWRHDFWRAQRRALQAPAIDWRRALLSLTAAAALALAWYLPNRTYVHDQHMLLGDWLPLLWTVVFAAAFYALALRRSSRVANFWSALLLAPSPWPASGTCPRIGFLQAPVGRRLWHRSRPAGGLGPAAARHVHSLCGFLDYRPHGSACRRADSPRCLSGLAAAGQKSARPTGAHSGVLRRNHSSSTGSCLPVPGSF